MVRKFKGSEPNIKIWINLRIYTSRGLKYAWAYINQYLNRSMVVRSTLTRFILEGQKYNIVDIEMSHRNFTSVSSWSTI